LVQEGRSLVIINVAGYDQEVYSKEDYDNLQAENARLKSGFVKIVKKWRDNSRGFSDYAIGYDDALDMVSDIALDVLK